MEALASLSNADVTSGVVPRWQRKQEAAMTAAQPSTPVASKKRAAPPQASAATTAAVSEEAVFAPITSNALNLPRSAGKALPYTPSQQQQQKRRALATPSHGTNVNDRYITARSAMDMENANYSVRQALSECASATDASGVSKPPPTPQSEAASEFHRTLKDSMGAGESRVLAFRKKAPVAPPSLSQTEDVLYAQIGRRRPGVFATEKPTRSIPSNAEKVLDAPDLLNDFYINPLDWSSANQLGVALGPTVYLWSAAAGSISELCTLDEARGEYVASLRFVPEGGAYAAVGSSDKIVSLWDVESQKCLRKMGGHMARVSALAWNGPILTSAGRDAQIIHHDVRVANHIVSRPGEGHSEEVCSLAWSHDGFQLASGSGDNTVCLWDARGGSAAAPQWRHDAPRLRLTQHQAAVKALAWCPYQRNVLATGGGTSDRTIKIWNTSTGNCDVSVDTGSQVCSLAFNPHAQELLSSHGYSENQLSMWKFPTMSKLKDLSGHSARVLHLTVSPDGMTVCSAAADETLRLWKVFGGAVPAAQAPGVKSAVADSTKGRLQNRSMSIR